MDLQLSDVVQLLSECESGRRSERARPLARSREWPPPCPNGTCTKGCTCFGTASRRRAADEYYGCAALIYGVNAPGMPAEPAGMPGLSTSKKPGATRKQNSPPSSSSSTITDYFPEQRRPRGRPRKLKTAGADEKTTPSPARCLYDELDLLVPEDMFALEALEEMQVPEPPLNGPLLGTNKSVLLNLFSDVRLAPAPGLVDVPSLLCTEPPLDTEPTEPTEPPGSSGGCKPPAKKRVRFEGANGTKRGGPEKAPRVPAGRLYGLVVQPVAEIVIWS